MCITATAHSACLNQIRQSCTSQCTGSIKAISIQGGAYGDYTSVGTGEGEGFSVNVPWSCGMMGDEEYVRAFKQVFMPIAHEFNPDLVLISAGFDAARGDPLGGCDITAAGYGETTVRPYDAAKLKICSAEHKAVALGPLVASDAEGFIEMPEDLIDDSSCSVDDDTSELPTIYTDPALEDRSVLLNIILNVPFLHSTV